MKTAPQNLLTNFDKISPGTLPTRVDKIIATNRVKLRKLLARHQKSPAQLNWNNSFQLLDDWDEQLVEDLFAPAGHLKSVRETSKLRDAYNAALPKVIAYRTDLMQSTALYELGADLRGTANLSEAQSSALDIYLLGARLLGAGLPPQTKKEYKKLADRLARLSNRFAENLLDATMAWSHSIRDESILKGLPASVKDQLKQKAHQYKKSDYLINLEEPVYRSIIRFAEEGTLREKVYRAYATRASELGEHQAKYNNTPVLHEIVLCRYKKAKLLGFKNAAEMLMATNMIREPQVIINFINDLAARALPLAKQEANTLREFARKSGKKKLQAWDTGFYSEKLRNEKFNFSAEEMRAYFPLPRVLNGMFGLARRLFDIRFTEEKTFKTWHPDVRLFAVRRGRELLGHLYCDLYARPHKRSGAWMDENRSRRRRTDGSLQLPVAYLVCNFRAPTQKVSLLEHGDVLTLFHELGHCLHHLLTQVECRGVSGIGGVPHDMVELPSQLMENWCWNEGFIKTISSHHKTGKTLPASKLKGLIASRSFQGGLALMRQLEFSLFDMRIHTQLDEQELRSKPNIIHDIYKEISMKFNPLPREDFVRFPNAFAHVFAGGYAAGYYAYKWAEVMSADIYGTFEKEGIYDKKLAHRIRRHIFERGGVGDARQNFRHVLGRDPKPESFFKTQGIG